MSETKTNKSNKDQVEAAVNDVRCILKETMRALNILTDAHSGSDILDVAHKLSELGIGLGCVAINLEGAVEKMEGAGR